MALYRDCTFVQGLCLACRGEENKPHRKQAALVITVLAILLQCVGCSCAERACHGRAKRYGSVPDTFERYVIVGYGDKPVCPLPGGTTTPRLVAAGQPITIWVRAVYRDAVNKPVAGVPINFSLVDDFGAEVPVVQPNIYLQPPTISTGADGFYFGGIVFIAQHQGHYRVRATYKDKNADAKSYGGLIIVQ